MLLLLFKLTAQFSSLRNVTYFRLVSLCCCCCCQTAVAFWWEWSVCGHFKFGGSCAAAAAAVEPWRVDGKKQQQKMADREDACNLIRSRVGWTASNGGGGGESVPLFPLCTCSLVHFFQCTLTYYYLRFTTTRENVCSHSSYTVRAQPLSSSSDWLFISIRREEQIVSLFSHSLALLTLLRQQLQPITSRR